MNTIIISRLGLDVLYPFSPIRFLTDCWFFARLHAPPILFIKLAFPVARAGCRKTLRGQSQYADKHQPGHTFLPRRD
jgi:hypothetical protein